MKLGFKGDRDTTLRILVTSTLIIWCTNIYRDDGQQLSIKYYIDRPLA